MAGRIVGVRPLVDGDLPEWTLVPGFVDLQVNGIDTVDVAVARDGDWDTLDGSLVAQGVTAWCPTLVSAPFDRYPAAAGPDRRRPRPGTAPDRRSWVRTWKVRSWANATGRTRPRWSSPPTSSGSPGSTGSA